MAAADTDLDSVLQLKAWLVERVGNDQDCIICDLQDEFGVKLAEEDETGGAEGDKEWESNLAGIAAYEESRGEDWGGLAWHWDGFRRCHYSGQKDASGHLEGEGTLNYDNGDRFQGVFSGGILERVGRLTRCGPGDLPGEGTTLEGACVHGLLEGAVKENLASGGWREGYYSGGVRHGFYREFGPRRRLRSFGHYYHGVPSGWCWRSSDDGGWLVGRVNSEGQFTGLDIAYIYPDMKMTLKGSFKDSLLVSGFQCELVGSSQENGVFLPLFGPAHGSFYEFEQQSPRNIALHPLLRDPWETQQSQVLESKQPQGGEGLFARKNIHKNEVVAFYSGIKVKPTPYASDYKMKLDDDMDIDIPTGCLMTSQYCATLAHKTNHSFTPNCEWSIYEHPRFGMVKAVTTLVDIAIGEEYLVNYSMAMSRAPDWYRQVWLQHMRDTGNDDAAIQRFIEREYELQGVRISLPQSKQLSVPQPVGSTETEVSEPL